MVAVSGNTLKDARLRKYNGNSTEFEFVFKSYSGVVARTTGLVALMSSLSKMRTGTSDRSAAESWLIPMESGWDKGKNKEQEEKGNENPMSGLSSNCRGIVGGDEGPIGGVAQVIGCHGVKVGVGVHGEEGQEEDGEVQGEVKGEVEENQGRRHMDGMRMEWQTLNGLEPMWSVMNQ